MRSMSAIRASGESLMPCSFCTLEPGTANMPPESEELPPTKAIFQIRQLKRLLRAQPGLQQDRKTGPNDHHIIDFVEFWL